MKITLELPDSLARKFKASVPNCRRSKLIAELLAKRLKTEDDSLEKAARKANRLKHVNEDMKAWEAQNTDAYPPEILTPWRRQ